MLTLKEDDDLEYFYRFHQKKSLVEMRRELNGQYLSATYWPPNTSENPKDLGSRKNNEGWPHDEFIKIQKTLKEGEKIFKIYVWRTEKDLNSWYNEMDKEDYMALRIKKSCPDLRDFTQVDDDYLPGAFILYQIAKHDHKIYGPTKISWNCIEGLNSGRWVPLKFLID